jgi:hypothetical protein
MWNSLSSGEATSAKSLTRGLGMTPADNSSDLIVNLAYRHLSLYSERQKIDPLMRMEAMNVELHYIANIDITMRERQGGKVV